MVQSTVSCSVQVALLVKLGETSSCSPIIITAISSSIISLVVTLFEIVFHSSSLSSNASKAEIEISTSRRISTTTTSPMFPSNYDTEQP